MNSRGRLTDRPSPSPLFAALALPFGILTGAAAGLIGVGGGEFRIPFLMAAYPHRVKSASAVNLVVGLITVILSTYRRVQLGTFANSDWTLASLLIVASLAGATMGARRAHGVRSERLRKIIIGYLLIVGAWMVYEAATQTDHLLLEPGSLGRWLLGTIVGFVVGFISPVFGVAGGEMRIPALMYLLAVPIKEAGTLSLVASIPTVAAGALTYQRLGHIDKKQVPLALLLGSGSVIGVLLGVAFLPGSDPHLLKGVLGTVLILAALGLLLARHPKRADLREPNKSPEP